MTERIFTIHRTGIDRFTAIVDGQEIVAVSARDYDAMEAARDMVGRELDRAEAELAHIKQFLSPAGWQKAQDEHNALRSRLADAERNEETLLGMIRHQRDVLRECLPYINESMAGRRPGRCADDIRAAVKALTADSASHRESAVVNESESSHNRGEA